MLYVWMFERAGSECKNRNCDSRIAGSLPFSDCSTSDAKDDWVGLFVGDGMLTTAGGVS